MHDAGRWLFEGVPNPSPVLFLYLLLLLQLSYSLLKVFVVNDLWPEDS